jgi:hypothetical protein
MTNCRRSLAADGLARIAAFLAAGAVFLALATVSFAAAPVAAQPKTDAASAAAPDKLATDERHIAEKYKHLEDVLLRMAELNAATDPRRAALLKKTIEQSKDRLVGVRFERLVDLLGKDQLTRAIENEAELDQDLRAILELLMSENRDKSLKSQKERTREYLKRISEIIAQQNSLQGRTAGGDNPKRLANEQAELGDKTGKLADDIRKNEEGRSPDKDAKGAKGEKGEKAEGHGSPSDSGDRAQQEDQSGNPARKSIDAAKQRMSEAEEALKKAQADPAGKKEEEARAELEKAKAELEEILRQLRQEEVERVLVMLEARFRKMLQMQEEVYEGTTRLDKVPSDQRSHNDEIEASRLSGRETQIVVEIDKALSVLRDDGSTAAFLEAAEQLRDDMRQVVQRLAQAKVGQTTQNIEEDVITSLKEIIEAIKKAQKDQQNRKKPPNSQPGQPSESALVDSLAELKMIRALQMRVNMRTARYSKLLEGNAEQTQNAELLDALKRLAERQQRIYRVTHDLQTGKNQ